MPLSPAVPQTALQARIEKARAQTDALFALIRPEFLYERPVDERHRSIFYLGHLEAFDWNLLGRGALGLRSFHPTFDKLFEFGIDPEPGQLPSDQPSDWPALNEILDYKSEVRRALDRVLAEAPEQRVQVALEHRLMHAETFTYLLHNLPYAQKRAPGRASWESSQITREENRMLRIPAGTATLGQAAGEFGWDNEFSQNVARVPEFSVAKYKVTNGEYLRFVEDGAAPPHFWTKQAGQWWFRGMFQPVPLPLDWPAFVTQAEASAYAIWSGKSLLTEAQFHRAAYAMPDGRERPYPWGGADPAEHHGNFDFRGWDPVSVYADPAGDSAFGVSQLSGNGWEWTSTPFGPFEGFQPFEFYPGYSRNFFDNAHYVLKGGSHRTAACFLRRSFRNWFRPNYPYVYASFRVVEN